MRPVGVWGLLPTGYRGVEWLQSDGRAFINTNIPGDVQSNVKVRYLDLGTSGEKHLFSAQSGVIGLGDWRMGLALFTWNGKHAAHSAYKQASFTPIIGEIMTLELNLDEIKLNGEPIPFREKAIPEFPVPTLAIFSYRAFGYNTAGDKVIDNIIGIRIPSSIRLYSLSMNGEYSCNFIPAVDDVGNPCLYESVRKETYYNYGTGAFLYPTASATYTLRRTIPDWGQLTENGLRRLYHAPEGYAGELLDYALENGFKPIVEEPAPEEGYWSPRWKENEDEIVLEWVKIDPPSES